MHVSSWLHVPLFVDYVCLRQGDIGQSSQWSGHIRNAIAVFYVHLTSVLYVCEVHAGLAKQPLHSRPQTIQTSTQIFGNSLFGHISLVMFSWTGNSKYFLMDFSQTWVLIDQTTTWFLSGSRLINQAAAWFWSGTFPAAAWYQAVPDFQIFIVPAVRHVVFRKNWMPFK